MKPLAAIVFTSMLVGASCCDAQVIHHSPRGYSLTLPQGWSINPSEKDFTAKGPRGAELSELALPPPPTQSLKEVTRLSTQSFVLLWGCTPTGQSFDLSGKHWKGQIAVLDLPSKQKQTAKQIVFFVAKSGKHFRQFYFSMPANEWQQHSNLYLAILRTLEFPPH